MEEANFTLEDFHRWDFRQSFRYNYLLFFYPTLIVMSAIAGKQRHFGFDQASLHVIQIIFLLPVILCLIGPLVHLATIGLLQIPVPIIRNAGLLMVFPFWLSLSTMSYVGTIAHFVVALLFPDFQFIEKQPLFRFWPYLFISRQNPKN